MFGLTNQLPLTRSLMVMKKNVENAKKLILDVITSMPNERKCSCGHALEGAML